VSHIDGLVFLWSNWFVSLFAII